MRLYGLKTVERSDVAEGMGRCMMECVYRNWRRDRCIYTSNETLV